jgi:hypothetical protein
MANEVLMEKKMLEPVFGDLRRWNGAEWRRGPVERFAGRRWNGAEWNWLELAKSGPKPADVSLKAAFGDSSAVVGSRVDYCPILMFFRVFLVSR